MPEPQKPSSDRTTQTQSAVNTGKTDTMICERCGKAEMFRMHAVWRCPSCGFKTDCCGW